MMDMIFYWPVTFIIQAKAIRVTIVYLKWGQYVYRKTLNLSGAAQILVCSEKIVNCHNPEKTKTWGELQMIVFYV